MAEIEIRGEFCPNGDTAAVLIYETSFNESVSFSVPWDAADPEEVDKSNVDIRKIIHCENSFPADITITPKTDDSGPYLEMTIRASGNCGYSRVDIDETFRLETSVVDCVPPVADL